MAEAFGWPEGQVYIATGTFAASAVVAYCENLGITLHKPTLNRVHADGTYRDHLTGNRADITIGAMWTYDMTIAKIFESATATHMKIINIAGGLGSAGYILYSGRITTFAPNGSNGNPFQYTLNYHANVWSAF
jgi:hypothetical protein